MAASEKDLGDLHRAVTKAYKKALDESEEINPALLTSASNFLKANGISCDPEDPDMQDVARQTRRDISEYPYKPGEDSLN